jgi:ribosomal protein L29
VEGYYNYMIRRSAQMVLIKEIKDEVNGLNKELIKLRNQLTEEKSEAKLSSVKNMLRIVNVISAKIKFMQHYDN